MEQIDAESFIKMLDKIDKEVYTKEEVKAVIRMFLLAVEAAMKDFVKENIIIGLKDDKLKSRRL